MSYENGLPVVRTGCSECRTDAPGAIKFSMAFQPIVHLPTRSVFAQEALVRGPNREGAATVLKQLTPQNLYTFDQACRVRAIEMAAALSPENTRVPVSINFIPGAVYKPENCIRRTLETASRVGTPLSSIVFEVTEGERIIDRGHLKNIFREYRTHGLLTAIDDFGAGYAQLTLLADFQPDILKLDMELIRDVHLRPASRLIVRAILGVCNDLNIKVIAEGIETVEECAALADLGVELFQGYLFAKPAFESFPLPCLPPLTTRFQVEQKAKPSAASTVRPALPATPEAAKTSVTMLAAQR